MTTGGHSADAGTEHSEKTTGGPLTVRTDHPGGNAHVRDVSADALTLAPDSRDSTQRWFYWNVLVESTAATDCRIAFPDDEVVGPRGPAVRSDGGDWHWLGAERRLDATAFEYTFAAGERVQFALSFPYQRADVRSLLADYDDHQELVPESLTTTDRGRSVPVVRVGPSDPASHVVLAARHHACESTASYVLDGFLRALLAGETDLLADCRVHAYPFVDVDGVVRGDPGKHRAPHDHNRDYVDANAIADVSPLYESTAAVAADVRSLPGPLEFALDLHCPFKWGGDVNDRPFFVTDPDHPGTALRDLATTLETVTTADGDRTLTFDATPGVGLASFDGQSGLLHTFERFCRREGAAASTTLEVPYVGTEADPVTVAGARQFGRDLATAVERWGP